MKWFIQKVDGIAGWIHRASKRLVKGLKNPEERKLIIRDTVLICVVGGIFLFSAFLLWAVTLKTPDLNSFDDRLLGQSAKIYDRTGTILLYDLSQKVRRTTVPFDKISPFLKQGTISIEDADFYTHKGIKATSIARAILANIFSLKFSQGGSTITQQVVKNSLLTTDKKISRKLKEWILAIKLEQVATKDEILNLYLNDSPYGGNIYGVEEASSLFFAKKSADLTLAEAAYLAAIPQAPSYYSPYGNHVQDLVDRKNLVLKKMYEYNYITEEQYNAALKEEVKFQPRSVGSIKAPHFVMYIKDYLEEKYGERLLQTGGFKVITTIDYEIQRKAEDITKEYVLKNEKTFKADNGAMTVVDPKSGQILAMVGSRDYFDKEIQGNFNVTTAHRQPGSAFKPFVYATAFNQGYTPETPLFDVATEFNASCSVTGQPNGSNAKCYNPDNYEGGFKGLMNIRKALAESRNVPAVKMLYLVGIDNALRTARAMGIESLGSANQYGLSLVLGGGEVSLLDMTGAYGVFANDGMRNKNTGILKVETSAGEVLEEFATSSVQVLPTQSARLMNDVLSDIYARNTIFTLRYTGDHQVAIKTGTTNNSRDAWIIGYTPNISVGAWMGNNDNTPMVQLASARIVAPMWKQLMDYLLEKYPSETFEKPDKPDQDINPFLLGKWYGSEGEIHSELYWIDKSNPKGPRPTNPAADSQFTHWEYGVQNWAGGAQAQSLLQNAFGTSTPGQTGGTMTSSGFSILYPTNGASVRRGERVTISVGNAPATLNRVEYYINGNLIGTASQSPYSFSFIPAEIAGIGTQNSLKAIGVDTTGARYESSVSFTVAAPEQTPSNPNQTNTPPNLIQTN